MRVVGTVVDESGKGVPRALVIAKCHLGDGTRTSTPINDQADQFGNFSLDIEWCSKIVVQAARSALADPATVEVLPPTPESLLKPVRLVIKTGEPSMGILEFRARTNPSTPRTVEIYRNGSMLIGVEHRLSVCNDFRFSARTGTYRIYSSGIDNERNMVVVKLAEGDVKTVWLK
jgi:hypothetical protein